jgi:CheY-like chemotaxis protein
MKRVLIVEDYPNLQQMYKSVLEAEGFEVWVANDGEEGLAAAQKHEPDLIILDLLMPKVGGLEFLRGFNLEKHSHVKVIIFSNMASPELFEEAKELGVTQYLIKAKYTPKELAGVVQKALEER